MSFDVFILGSNSALPAHGRHPSAQILNHNDRYYLIDCGEGTQMRLSYFGLRRSKIDVIFISHLHGDHIYGLPGLLTSYVLSSRPQPLKIIGPKGLYKFIDVCVSLEKINLTFDLEIIEIEPEDQEIVFENRLISVKSFPLDHKVSTSGYLFSEQLKERHLKPNVIEEFGIPYDQLEHIKKGQDFIPSDGNIIPNAALTTEPDPSYSYAYCSDTAYSLNTAKFVAGVTCMYHEATFLSDLEEQAARRKHSTAKQAAQVARDAGVNKLLIGHFSTRYIDLNPLLNEARQVFSNTFLAEEGKKFDIK